MTTAAASSDALDPTPSPSRAAGGDLLARAFLDLLAEAQGLSARSLLRSLADPADPIEQLLDDLGDEPPETERVALRADVAAVAILVARAIEAEPGLARRLRREAPVITIATHTPDLVGVVEGVIRACALPASCAIAGSDIRDRPYHTPTALILARDGSGKDDKPETGNGAVAIALSRGLPAIGIAPDPKRVLPSSLLRTAEYRLALPALDEVAVALVVEAVTGRAPARAIDPDVLRVLDVEDLPLALRADRTPEACLDKLEALVRGKSGYLGEGPSLEDLDGYGAAKAWGLELAADLAGYRAGRLAWSDVDHKGLLLSGPPGVGKTQFARALARTCRVPLVATSVAEWNAASYLSGTLQAIRKVFAQARRQAPCILFIDEMDGISDRARLRGDHVEYWSQIVNLLLEMLAGVDDRPGVVVVAATNHPDRIDPAVRRAGRLDREIVIERPDPPTLERIFRYHLGADAPGESLLPLALAGHGMTGADVEAVVRRARGKARRVGRALALEDVLAEMSPGGEALSPEVRRRVAVHEAGHVVVARALGTGTVLGVSLHDRGGRTQMITSLDGSATLDTIERHLALWMAGRAAEELLLEDASIGAGGSDGSDLGTATALACNLELRFGLGALGPVYVPSDDAPRDLVRVPGLIGAVKARLEAAHERATMVLTGFRPALERIATALESAGVLGAAEIDALVDGDLAADALPARAGRAA